MMVLPTWLIVLFALCGIFFLFLIHDKLVTIVELLRANGIEPPK